MLLFIGFVIMLLFIAWISAVSSIIFNRPYFEKHEIIYSVVHTNENEVK